MPYKTCLHHNSIPFDQEWWRVTSNRNVSDSMSYEPFSKTNFRISDNTVSILEMMNNLFCKSRWWSKMECFTNWFEVGFRCGKCHRFVYGSSDPMDYGDHRVFHKSSKGLNVVSFVLVFVFHCLLYYENWEVAANYHWQQHVSFAHFPSSTQLHTSYSRW